MSKLSPDPVVVTENPYNAGTPLNALNSDITPSDLVYVRNHFEVPELDPSEWSLNIGGRVITPLSLSMQDIKDRPADTLLMTLECAGNGRIHMNPLPKGTPWGDNAVSIVQFTGTPLRGLLEEAEVREDAAEVVFVGADQGQVERGREEPYARSLPLEIALGPDVLLAWEMNGESLSLNHGHPLRLVVPGWYGMASVKWLREIKVVKEPFRGFFQSDHYVYSQEEGIQEGEPVRHIRVRSLTIRPEAEVSLDKGAIEVAGIAWSGQGEIIQVDLSFNGGERWDPAEIIPALSAYGVQRWHYEWKSETPGSYEILARATDSEGNTQPVAPRWNRLGYGNNGVHSVQITIL